VIRDSGAFAIGSLSLRLHGKVFAAFDSSDRFEVRLAGAAAHPRATGIIHDGSVSLMGELLPAELGVRPRARLLDGWIGVRRARYVRVADGVMTIGIELPGTVHAATEPSFDVPCSDLTILAAPRTEAEWTPISLAPGKTALSASIEGVIVAEIDTPSPPPRPVLVTYDTFELERRGAWVRVHVESRDSFVEGWVDAGSVRPHPGGSYAKYARGPILHFRPTHRCAEGTPLWVRDGASLVRVGEILRGEGVALDERELQPAEGHALALHLLLEGELPPPFVKADAVEGCTRVVE
jgi:hypothetical protein